MVENHCDRRSRSAFLTLLCGQIFLAWLVATQRLQKFLLNFEWQVSVQVYPEAVSQRWIGPMGHLECKKKFLYRCKNAKFPVIF